MSTVFLFALMCLVGMPQSSTLAERPSSFQEVVKAESNAVQQEFPTARLFEVSVFNVKLSEIGGGKVDATSVQSSYYVGEKNRYVKAMQEPTSQPAETKTVILEKKAESRPCKKPYPNPDSAVCEDGPIVFEDEPQSIPVSTVSDNALAAALSKLDLSPSTPVNLTFTTAGRLLEDLQQQPSTSDGSLRTRLIALNPKQSIIRITPVGGEAKLRELITYLNGDNFEVVARTARATKHMPPNRIP